MENKKMGRPISFPDLTSDETRDRIIRLRRRLGISQDALGGMLGVTGRAVRGWEAGISKLSGPTMRLLQQLEEGETGNKLSPPPGNSGKHRSIGERLQRAKSTDAKKKTALNWANDWKYEQTEIIKRLKRALETGERGFLDRALRELEGVTDKKLSVLPRVIELLLEGVEDVDE